jgi:hypothetical protein
MAAQLPLDFSHPAVREYVKLIRLQVLTPLSTLVSIATMLATELIIRPSLGEIVGLWPTSISPEVSLVALYYLVLFGSQVGGSLYDDDWPDVRSLDRLLFTTGTSLVSARVTRSACSLPECFCLLQERTNESVFQTPGYQASPDLFLESNSPWSWIPSHSRQLAHGCLGGCILFPSLHGLQRPDGHHRHPLSLRQPSRNVVSPRRLDLTDRLFAPSRSDCEQSSGRLVCAFANTHLAPLLVDLRDLDAPPFDLPRHWTSVDRGTQGSLRQLPMGGLHCCPLHRSPWHSRGCMEK